MGIGCIIGSRLRILTWPMALLMALPLAASGGAGDYAKFLENPLVQQYITDISQRHALERSDLVGYFKGLSPQQSVLERISKPAERTLKWYQYRRIFLSDARIAAGTAFARQHVNLLLDAERRFGVPWQIITAIIGVETYFGRYTGKDAVLPALATLAFNYPKRSTFFKKELTEFLLLSREESLAPTDLLGSYAGAMGLPQFIASSYRRYAIDFDDDGRRDLWSSNADVIGSVANYFKQHGWRPGEPVAERLYPDTVAYRKLLTRKRKPRLTTEQLSEVGLQPRFRTDGKMSLMEFQQKKIRELWLGYFNFYVITQYNHSKLYAKAVLELSDAILNAGDIK